MNTQNPNNLNLIEFPYINLTCEEDVVPCLYSPEHPGLLGVQDSR